MRIVAVTLLALLGSALMSHLVIAETSPFNGVYVLDESASDDVAAKIDGVVDQMNFVTGFFARDRLAETNIARRQLTVSLTATAVSVKADDQDAIVTPANGEEVEVVTSGDTVKVRTTRQGDTLVRVFRSGNGQRANTYSLNASGDILTLDVQVTSPRLPKDLVYRLVYRRLN